MSAPLQIALALGSVGVLLGLMAVVRKLAQVRHVGPEMQRKLIHIGTGLYAIALPWLFPDRWPVYFLVVVTLFVMLWLRLPGSKLGHTLHGVDRKSYGDLLLAVSVGLCLFLSGDRPYLYVLPIAVLTLSDAMAALVGSAYGRRFFTVAEGRKSVEGSTVFFGVTLLISMVCLMLMTTLPPLNIIMLSLMVAGFGTLVEAASWRGFDNLFLPMGLLIFLSVHAQDSVVDLAVLATVFAGSAVGFRMVAPRLGLTRHASHVYVTAVFLVLASVEAQNVLFPIGVLAAHIWSRTAAPTGAGDADLDVVAALAMVSFGSLALGTAMQASAVSFYGLIAMGMMVALCALALSPRGGAARIIGLGLVVLVAILVRFLVVEMNPVEANWNGKMWPLAGVCLLLCAGVPGVWPGAFARARMTKLTLLALLPPLGAYLYAVDMTGLWA